MTAGRPKNHIPANIGKIGVRKPARTALKSVRQLFDILDQDERSYQKIGKVAGAHKVTISRWRSGLASPNLVILEAMCEVLGYRLTLTPIDKSTPDVL